MDQNWLLSTIHKKIYEKIYIHLNSKHEIPINLIINKIIDNNIREKITDLALSVEKFTPTIDMVADCLRRLEKRILKSELLDLRNQVKKSDGDKVLSIINKITLTEKNISDLINKYK